MLPSDVMTAEHSGSTRIVLEKEAFSHSRMHDHDLSPVLVDDHCRSRNTVPCQEMPYVVHGRVLETTLKRVALQ